jgi:hypothetical protein
VQNLLLKSSLPEVVSVTGPNFNANRSGLLIGVIIHEGVLLYFLVGKGSSEHFVRYKPVQVILQCGKWCFASILFRFRCLSFCYHLKSVCCFDYMDMGYGKL